YSRIEKTAAVLAGALFAAIGAAAIGAKPDWGPVATGLVPTLPADLRIAEVLPWLGFMLSGAAGMLWFSYWVQAKGYGAATAGAEPTAQDVPSLAQPPAQRSGEDVQKLRAWVRQMTGAITLAVVGATVIAVSFLVLGTELLRPKRLTPEANEIAQTLGRLLGDLWGRFGFWFMVSAIALTFLSTLLSSVDGYHRMFSEGAELLRRGRLRKLSPQRLKQGLLLGVLTALPAATYLIAGDPVQLLKLAGVIEAIHIPLVTGLVLHLNKKTLPTALQSSGVSFWGTVLAGLFFGGFALAYLLQLTGVTGP
ncbi:MAG: Nramp family divalent metal transporter, partial [Hymenobacter sp.]|nr:Nramp family divalent metal transporter [Hymenobacter sp.]